MKQVTKDHIVGNSDAQSNLRDDSPMSNCASASDAFFVDGMQLSFHMPLIVVAATDGCYDYVETPAQFEYILLSTMARAECEQTWKLLLISEFQKIAGDDCTMALAGFGWSSFIQMQNAYAHRLKYLEEMLKPLDALNRKIHELEQYKIEKTTCINNIWTEYKKSYEVHHLNKNQRWPT
jgi:hypothetical protein